MTPRYNVQRGRPLSFRLCTSTLVPLCLVASATHAEAQRKAYVVTAGANLVTVIDTASGAGIALNPITGAVTVAAGTPVGTYSLRYSLCEIATPSNCARGTVKST